MTVTQPEWVEALKRPAAYLLKSPEKIKLSGNYNIIFV